MRLALPILVAALGLAFSGARGDEPFHPVDLEFTTGYIIPESYAEAHRAGIIANIPSSDVRIDGFWTPGESSAYVADRVLREMIHRAEKDPTVLFPDIPKKALAKSDDPAENLEHQREELESVSANFQSYDRQYVGIIIKKTRYIFCNYSVGTKVDASTTYIFTDKFFVPDGTVHFLQCRFDPEEKECSNVSMIGEWTPAN